MSSAASCIIVLHVLILVQVSVIVCNMQREEPDRKMLLKDLEKKGKNDACCGYFIIILTPLPAWHAARLPRWLPPQRKKRQEECSVSESFLLLSVTVSSTEVFPSICWSDLSADCALHRAVNTFQRGPCRLSSESAVDAVEPGTRREPLSLLNPMRWAFLSRLQGN